MSLRTCLPQFATLICTVSIIYHGCEPLRNHELYDLDVQILFRNSKHNGSPFYCNNTSFHFRMYLLVPMNYSETLPRSVVVPSVKLVPVQTGSHISSAPCAPPISSKYSDKCSLILLLLSVYPQNQILRGLVVYAHSFWRSNVGAERSRRRELGVHDLAVGLCSGETWLCVYMTSIATLNE